MNDDSFFFFFFFLFQPFMIPVIYVFEIKSASSLIGATFILSCLSGGLGSLSDLKVQG